MASNERDKVEFLKKLLNFGNEPDGLNKIMNQLQLEVASHENHQITQPTHEETYRMLPLLVSKNLGKISHFDCVTGTQSVIWDKDGTLGLFKVSDFREMNSKIGRFAELCFTADSTPVVDAAKCASLFDESMKNRHDSWLEKAVATANLEQPCALDSLPVGEMFLQQSIYSAFADLLFSIYPANYRADQEVNCCHAVYEETEAQTGPIHVKVTCKPDGATTLVQSYYVAAIMELKPRRAPNNQEVDLIDMAKCVLLTSMSALFLRESGLEEDIFIPFLIGSVDEARLFITALGKHKKQIEIKLVESAELSDLSMKATIFAKLAILLADITNKILSISPTLKRTVMMIPNKRPDLPTLFSSSSSKRSGADDGNGSSAKRTNSRSAGPKTRSAPSERENMAKMIASRDGKVQALVYPWARLKVFDFGDLSHEISEQREFEYFQQRSPYYFVGYYSAGEEVAVESDAVFCKVWREGDHKTDLSSIQEEIAFLKEANEHGVPCPILYEDLTALNVGHPLYPTETFHVMVMSKLACDQVRWESICDFALSLIQAVRKLHSIGLLHCDIKNSNIAWSEERKRVSLIDFGHTQREDGASAYSATKGFEAPEIKEKQPHSRVTDTYSVGKTIAEVLGSVEQSSVGGQNSDNDYDVFDTLQTIIKKLTALVSSDRMTLEEAESLMTTAQTSTGSPPQKRQNTGQTIPITPTPGNTLERKAT
jgi:hypothetical protein